jgi:hypothetical protein
MEAPLRNDIADMPEDAETVPEDTQLGDAIFAVLCGCGHNIRKLLGYLRTLLTALLASLLQLHVRADSELTLSQTAA